MRHSMNLLQETIEIIEHEASLGVTAIYDNLELIAECEDLAKRLNAGATVNYAVRPIPVELVVYSRRLSAIYNTIADAGMTVASTTTVGDDDENAPPEYTTNITIVGKNINIVAIRVIEETQESALCVALRRHGL